MLVIFGVQVRKRPLNKKELAKNEEDIIETHNNSLTVHETKLKVSPSMFFSPCCQDYCVLKMSIEKKGNGKSIC